MTPMNWPAVYPEIALLLMACVVAMVDLWVTDPRRTPTYWLTQASLAVVAMMQLGAFNAGDTVYAMQRMVVADPMGHLLGFFATVAVMVTLVYARPYAASREMLKGELFTLSLFSLLGICVMLSANNFLVVYLGLELMSLSLYALVAMRRDHVDATEAAMKYFVLGALASGFLLYGLSMMYGATGSLDINEVFKAIGTGQINKQVLILGEVFVVAGLAFKLGAVPFHMWVPDVYQGAPTAVTLLIGGAPKLASKACWVWRSTGSRCWSCCHSGPCCSATSSPSRRATSSACWRIRASRRWASCCWACAPAWSTATRCRPATLMHRRCSTS
jgi:NADH-quinone oxidoreductase subunit N